MRTLVLRVCALGFLWVLMRPDHVLAGPPLVPPQLLAACAKLASGAACTVQFQQKTLAGVCQELPDHSRACLPPKRGKSGKTGKPSTTPAQTPAPKPQ